MRRMTPVELAEQVRQGSRPHIARAITLVESSRADHREQAKQLLRLLRPASGNSVRVGITGVPGAGKSTFIDALGVRLIDQGHRIAVLAVDPSSSRTGGSILGDRTRMAALTESENAYVRPSPSGGHLGGVARATRESMIVMEAAGFDVVDEFSFGLDYARTLRLWRDAFLAQEARVLELGFDKRFIRIWEFYLCYCEAAFSQANTSVMQFTLRKR